jgi:predicted transcriptional regulator
MLAVEALVLMKKKGFDNIPVVNAANCPVGIVDERDLISEGISE